MSRKLKAVQKLVKFVIEQTEQGNHCFVEFSGHVQMLSFKSCSGEWYADMDYPVREHIFFEHHTDQKIEIWVNDIISKVQALTPTS